MDYYREIKWCRACRRYVNYLQSLDASFCCRCGSRVFLFRDDELARFRESVGIHGPLNRVKATTRTEMEPTETPP